MPVRWPHGRRVQRGVLPRRQAPRLCQPRRHGAHLAGAVLTSIRKEPTMTTWLIRCFAFLLLMLPFVPAVADDPDDKEIARLVKHTLGVVSVTFFPDGKRIASASHDGTARIWRAPH